MPDRRVTLFELHTHGNVQFGPSTVPGIGGSDETDETEPETASAEAEEGGGNAVRVLLALGVLVAAAAAIRRFRGDEAERPEVPLEESDEIAPTQD